MLIRSLISIAILLITFTASAQFASSRNYNLGALYAHGVSNGQAVDQSALFSQGDYHTKTNAYAFYFNFASMRQTKGIHAGALFSLALGGSSDKYMGENLGGGWSDIDGVWGKDFGLFIDMRVGPTLYYTLPDQKLIVGFRYFNWYNSNAFGGTYSNADDAASIGATILFNKLGFDYSYGSDKIPGVLVNAHAWNLNEVAFRYQLKYNEDTNGGILAGVRVMAARLMETSSLTNTPDTNGMLVSAFLLFH